MDNSLDEFFYSGKMSLCPNFILYHKLLNIFKIIFTMTNIILTKTGLENFKNELGELKTIKRKEVAERLKKALEQGDLSENAEYAEAKDQQAFLEGRIAELEIKIKNAQIIEEKKTSLRVVDVGSTIKIKFNEKELIYKIVGSSEADPAKGLISNESPMGKFFLGHQVGDVVEVKTPSGVVNYEILEVE